MISVGDWLPQKGSSAMAFVSPAQENGAGDTKASYGAVMPWLMPAFDG